MKYILDVNNEGRKYEYNMFTVFEYEDGNCSEDTRVLETDSLSEFATGVLGILDAGPEYVPEPEIEYEDSPSPRGFAIIIIVIALLLWGFLSIHSCIKKNEDNKAYNAFARNDGQQTADGTFVCSIPRNYLQVWIYEHPDARIIKQSGYEERRGWGHSVTYLVIYYIRGNSKSEGQTE